LHWIDFGWYLGLVALSSGTNSIFFFFVFFSILVASFWWGFSSGWSVTITATVLFTIVGYLTAPREPNFELNRFLLRPLCLLVLGYLMAYWGGHEVKLKQRLEFLRNINKFSNPRFGIERTITWMMDQLRGFYQADGWLLVLRDNDGQRYLLRRSDSQSQDDSAAPMVINEELSRMLLGPNPAHAVIQSRSDRTVIYDILSGETSSPKQADSVVTTFLGCKSFLSVPVYYRSQPLGRLFLTAKRARFSQSDIEFVIQVMDQIIPVLDNIRLVDELASDAAEQERQKIARDIHDGIVQPYIGLNLGLTAVGQKIERGDNNVAQDIKNLSELVLKEIADWRAYIGGLKDGRPQEEVLVPAVRRFAARFSKATGIEVTFRAPDSVRLNDRLAAEVFYMVTEGLSNIRRHTGAHRAQAEIRCENGHLVVKLENENPDKRASSFRPRSLSDRAEALGGSLNVRSESDNRTVVEITIPL
jgi:signal transduction histidine kinase